MKAVRLVRLGAVAVTVAFLAACTASSPAQPTASTTPSSAATRTPTPTPPVDPAVAYAEARLASMTLREKIATLLMLHAPGTDPAALRAFVERYRPGGFIVMGDNVPADEQALTSVTTALSPDPELPLLVGIDQEGGAVRRLDSDGTPGAETLRGQPPEATRAAFAQRGELLASLGISVNFGIVADVTADPGSFIADRVLGTDPADAAERVAAAAAGEKGRVLSTLKHFPGHGETAGDSHSSVPDTPVSLDAWRQRDAPPFAAGIAAGAELVMFGHLVYSGVDSTPASLSARWHEVLRDELGFTGVTITDDMLMLQHSGLAEYQDAGANAVRALAAGNTMLLYVLPADPASVGADPDTVISAVAAAVEDGRIDASMIEEDALAVLALRRGLS